MLKQVMIVSCCAAFVMTGFAASASPDHLHHLGCRIASRTAGSFPEILPLVDTNVDTLSGNAADRTFGAALHDGRRLEVSVQRVVVQQAGDRFNVAVKLDGKPYMRMNHLDLDIYLETVIAERSYVVHCFPDADASGAARR
jgi:hypothetical protein